MILYMEKVRNLKCLKRIVSLKHMGILMRIKFQRDMQNFCVKVDKGEDLSVMEQPKHWLEESLEAVL